MLSKIALMIGTVTVSGLVSGVVSPMPVYANSAPNTLVAVSPQASSLGNGTYLYGQSARPNQVRQTYMVFEVKNNRVVGAVFMPNSSYDCFHGSLDGDTLNAMVLEPYEGSSYPATVELNALYALPNVESNAKALLTSCRAETANQFQATVAPRVH